MLPQDPAILLSYVNTQLRDFYENLDDLCENLAGGKHTGAAVLKEKLITDLKKIDYEYDSSTNQFI